MFTAAKRYLVGEREVASPTSDAGPDRNPTQTAGQAESFIPPKDDPLNGLPGRAEAEGILAAALREGRPMYAAVFVVDRVNLVNDCFGYALGDKLLLSFHDQLRGRLPPGDPICRWSGTCFVALLERRDPCDMVEAEIRRLASQEAQLTVPLGGGALMLWAAASWAMFPLSGVRSADALVQSIDFYVARNLGR